MPMKCMTHTPPARAVTLASFMNAARRGLRAPETSVTAWSAPMADRTATSRESATSPGSWIMGRRVRASSALLMK